MKTKAPLHPEGRPFTPLERELWRLHLLGYEVQILLQGYLAALDRVKDPDLSFTLSNYGLILVCKFLEIWRDLGKLAKDGCSVRELRKSMKPLLDRILIWPGLREQRNRVLTHAYMDDKGNLVTPWEDVFAGRVPFQTAEIVVLLECARFAIAGTLARFGETHRAGILPTIGLPGQPPVTRGVSSGQEASVERKQIAELMQERFDALGISRSDPTWAMFPPPEQAVPKSKR